MGFKLLRHGKHVRMSLNVTSSRLITMVVFHNPRSTILGLISSMYALGAILAVPLVPYIADTFGRRRSVQLGSTLMIIGASIKAASQNLAMFMASRIIVGLGISFAIVAASALIGGKCIRIRWCRLLSTFLELSHPKERAYLGSLFNAFYFTGLSSICLKFIISEFNATMHFISGSVFAA